VGDDQITLTGCCLPFEKLGPPDASGIREIYKRGAFANSLRANKDITVMFNFRTDRVLGRTKAGTALVYESAEGLRFEVQPPTNNYGSDLVVSISRGDITGAAVAGIPTQSHLEYRGGHRVRVIDAAQLISVSICSFAQFDTGIGMSRKQSAPIAALTPEDRLRLHGLGVQGSTFV
jgi:HK97 family phage prohead protease